MPVTARAADKPVSIKSWWHGSERDPKSIEVGGRKVFIEQPPIIVRHWTSRWARTTLAWCGAHWFQLALIVLGLLGLLARQAA